MCEDDIRGDRGSEAEKKSSILHVSESCIKSMGVQELYIFLGALFVLWVMFVILRCWVVQRQLPDNVGGCMMPVLD